jgi:hypothetical protein
LLAGRRKIDGPAARASFFIFIFFKYRWVL